jgi:hypothetical protein
MNTRYVWQKASCAVELLKCGKVGLALTNLVSNWNSAFAVMAYVEGRQVKYTILWFHVGEQVRLEALYPLSKAKSSYSRCFALK